MSRFPNGTAHPRYVGPVVLTCRVCASSFTVEAKARRNRTICSDVCNAIYRSKQLPDVGKATRYIKGDARITKGEDALLNSSVAGTKLRVTRGQFDALMERQMGLCAICLRAPKKNRLHVDHNHQTGMIRGLLCFRCNYGVAWFQENADWLARAVAYIEEGGSNVSS